MFFFVLVLVLYLSISSLLRLSYFYLHVLLVIFCYLHTLLFFLFVSKGGGIENLFTGYKHKSTSLAVQRELHHSTTQGELKRGS